MSTTDGPPHRNDAGNRSGGPTRSGRRWGRILIPAVILLVVVAIVTFMLVVSQRGTEDDSEIYNEDTGSAALVVGNPGLVPALT